ncbi:MAG: DNA adenine methylase, partial [Phycisphaerales bacterium]
MKYMGSKRMMLTNGLGTLLKEEAATRKRVVDLFCGAASVAWFAAQNTQRKVLACDLQTYSIILAAAVLSRTEPADENTLSQMWLKAAETRRTKLLTWKAAAKLDRTRYNTATWAARARSLCETEVADCVLWNSYGGYY